MMTVSSVFQSRWTLPGETKSPGSALAESSISTSVAVYWPPGVERLRRGSWIQYRTRPHPVSSRISLEARDDTPCLLFPSVMPRGVHHVRTEYVSFRRLSCACGFQNTPPVADTTARRFRPSCGTPRTDAFRGRKAQVIPVCLGGWRESQDPWADDVLVYDGQNRRIACCQQPTRQ